METKPVPALKKNSDHGIQQVLEKASQFFEEKKYEEAVAQCEKAIEVDPKNIEAWNLKGSALFVLGRYEQAIDCYDTVYKNDPAFIHASVWNSKGNALSDFRKYTLAIECYDRALRVDPNHYGAWRNKGLALYQLGLFDQAVECCDKAIQINPQDKHAYIYKGVALNKLRKHDEAIHCYDRVLEIDPKTGLAWENKGITLYDLSKYDEGIQCFEKAIEIYPRSVGAWNYKGNCLYSKGNYVGAIECYDKVIELRPEYPYAWRNKAAALFDSGKPDVNSEVEGYYRKGIECSEKALKENPGSAELWENKGNCFEGLGDYTQAAECYEKSLEIFPKYEKVLAGLVFIYSERLKEPKKALELAIRILELDPEDINSRLNYIEALLKNGLYQDARTESINLLPKASASLHKCLLRLFLLCAAVYEIDRERILSEWNDFFLSYQEQPEDFRIDDKSWTFTGLIDYIHASSLEVGLKFLMITLIDLLQGKIERKNLSFFTI